ncbi:unnamed protein product [marine sediment metagenome]|uniref:Uncharacterized protein n=1 Tax=marine sediment metagenome TaxID=412755 RepID=X0VE40_9ZZZZ
MVYNCEKFPHHAAIAGLMRPGAGITAAAKACPEEPLRSCVICQNKEIIKYGGDIVSICGKHDQAWEKWLKKHPERRGYLHPKGRNLPANWVEVFREFVEDTRNANK